MELCVMTQPLLVVKLFGVQIVGVNHIWMVVWENGSLWLNLVLLQKPEPIIDPDENPF
jgi:hypothetical protein